MRYALDIRDKSDGRDAARKWFTGAIFQRFVEGGSDESVEGMKCNIEHIVDIIFKHAPAPAPAAASAAADAPAADDDAPTNAAKKSRAPRAGSRQRVGGFCAVGDVATPAAAERAQPEAAEVPPPEDSETASLRQRYTVAPTWTSLG